MRHGVRRILGGDGTVLLPALGLVLLLGSEAAGAAAPALDPPPAAVPAVIDTLAGGGPVGDGGPATEARLHLPGGVVIAPDGDLLIVDFGNHRIRRVDAETGRMSTLAGTGEAGYNGDGIPAVEARLARPEFAAFAPDGSLYIADSYNDRIRRIDLESGRISTVAGSGERGFSGDGGPATEASLHFPEGIAIDPEGHLYIGDTANRRIRRVDARSGIITTLAGTGEVGVSPDGTPAERARFLRVARLATDRKGDVYVADSPSHTLQRIDIRTRTVHVVAGTGEPGFAGDGGPATEARLSFPEGVLVAPDGDIYFADVGNHRVRHIDRQTGVIETVAGCGEKGFAGDGGPARAARLWSPGRLALDAAGDLFIADIGNTRIRKVDRSTGVITTVAGSGDWGDGGPAQQALLSVPGDIATWGDKLYIADYGNRRVRSVDLTSGRIETVAGGGTGSGDGIPALEAELLLPEGIAVDRGKFLYIADNLASRVWRVDLETGILHVFAGTGEPGFSGDGRPAREARLRLPGGVSVGPGGEVYIADYGNRRLRVVEPGTGIIRSLEGAAMSGGVVGLVAAGEELYRLVAEDPGAVERVRPRQGTVERLAVDTGRFRGESGDSRLIDLALDGQKLYLVDALAHRLLCVDLASGELRLVAGSGRQGFSGDGGPAAQAALFQPGAVAVGRDGRELYIADAKNHRVRRVRLLAVAEPAPEDGGPEGDGTPAGASGIVDFRLPNGLAVVVAQRPELKLAAVNLTVDVGSVDDPADQGGMAHVLEHVTLAGSRRLGSLDPAAEAEALRALDRAFQDLRAARGGKEPEAAELAELERRYQQAHEAAAALAERGEILGGRLEALGAIGLNATTTADGTQFFARIPAQAVEAWLGFEADRLQFPNLRRFYSEREVILREIEALTGGRMTAQERLLAEILPGTGAARPLAGDPERIRAFDRPQALEFFARHYRPESIAIAVVGDVDPEQIYQRCRELFGAWSPPAPEGDASDRRPRAATTLEAPLVRAYNSIRSPLVFLAFPSAPLTSLDAAAQEVLAGWINSEELSPWKRRLMGEPPLVWSLGAAARYPSEKVSAVFLVHLFGYPGVPHQTLIDQAMALLETLPETADGELDGALAQARTQRIGELEDPSTLASLLAFNQAVHGDWRLPFHRLEAYRMLRPEHLRQAARRWLASAGIEIRWPSWTPEASDGTSR